MGHSPKGNPNLPHWDLGTVKELAARQTGIWLGKKRALESFRTPGEAYATARKVIAGLRSEQFARVYEYEDNPNRFQDAYGVEVNGGSWFLKLCIADDEEGPGGRQVYVFSLHPLERDLELAKGGLMKK